MTFPDFFILFLGQLFFILNQRLSIRVFGRRGYIHSELINSLDNVFLTLYSIITPFDAFEVSFN